MIRPLHHAKLPSSDDPDDEVSYLDGKRINWRFAGSAGMFRIKPETVIIIGLSIAIIILAAAFGWYYYHVQNGLQYTGDPLYNPNGYQTQWFVGTSSGNVTFTFGHSTNQTIPFSIPARQMNSYLTITYAPCARWLYQNVSSPPPPTCAAPAMMNVYVVNTGYCEPNPAKPTIRESYSVQYHVSSNVLYESGNISTPTPSTARFPTPAGDYCIVIIDAGQTDLSVLMNVKAEYTTV